MNKEKIRYRCYQLCGLTLLITGICLSKIKVITFEGIVGLILALLGGAYWIFQDKIYEADGIEIPIRRRKE